LLAALIRDRAGSATEKRNAALACLGFPSPQPADQAPGAFRSNNHGSQKRAQFLQTHPARELPFVSIGNRPGFLGHDHDRGIGLLAQPDSGAMAGADGFVQIGTLRQRKDTSGIGDTIALDDDAAVMNRVIGKENSLQHFRRGLTIDDDAGLDRLVEINGLLNGNQRPDPHVGQPFAGAHDDFDVFALLVRGREEWQVAQFAEHATDFGLENDDCGQHEEERGIGQQPPQHLQLQRRRHHGQGQEQDGKTDHHRPAPRAADEPGGIIDAHRENENFQRGPPSLLNDLPKRHEPIKPNTAGPERPR